ncbi:MerR family transcriptional regulator [Phytoactinopolyspora endophytica]|uniref:MerR family transcriptional regulator n=1 Tax=Phytoactinopolyspora endophytica TaxID=1642495 RepID=UPI00101C46AF|nr:MerR family transcriptional regulator [Phytoactinopolyspora endophytica]
MPKADDLVPIGKLARRTGVATSALRYYERLGLLSPAELGNQGRRYTPESAERVAFIRLCQDAGFTLAETGRILEAWGREGRGWRQQAQRKVAELDARISDAQRAREMIQHALDCPHRDPNTCPNFRSALQARLNIPDLKFQ